MKKLIYLFMVMGLVITTACDPMDDIYANIDAQEDIIVGDAIITLTDDDYSSLNLDGGFDNVDDVKSMLPAFLTSLYPIWGDGSSVLVNYNMANGLTDLGSVTDFIDAGTYLLENEDYPGYGQNAFAFFPDEDPADYLGDILPEAAEGDIVLVRYNQYVNEPVTGIVNYFEANFNGSLENFETIDLLGSQGWYDSSYSGTEYAKMSGYSSGAQPNEDWLVSPEIDLTAQTNLTFQINQAINYASGELGLLNILVSTDFTTGGDPLAATWNTIDLTNTPSGSNWTFVLSEEFDLSAYEGETIHIAFKYESTDSVSATWEIDSAIIRTPGVEGETMFKEVYYMFNGFNWEAVDGVYYLNSDDYDSMGESSGEPGRYNNFDSSVAPSNYLPAFLQLKYPYAQEDDELIVMYKYYSGGTQTRGNVYTVINGEWVAHSPSLQFGHDGNTWVPDNTIKYTLTTADYDFLGEDYGSPGYYNNFDVRDGKPAADEAVRLDYINTILFHNFPGMEEGQKFSVYYAVYTGAAEVWEMRVILSGGVYILQ